MLLRYDDYDFAEALSFQLYADIDAMHAADDICGDMRDSCRDMLRRATVLYGAFHMPLLFLLFIFFRLFSLMLASGHVDAMMLLLQRR